MTTFPNTLMFINTHVAFFNSLLSVENVVKTQSFMFDALFHKPSILYVYTCERYGGDDEGSSL